MQARCSRRNFVKRIKNDTRFKSRRLNPLRAAAATTPLDGDRHIALERLARLRLCRGTARALPTFRVALDRHVQCRGAGPRLPRLCVERERGGRGVQLFRLDRFGWTVRPKRSRRKSRSEEHTSELQSPDHLVCRLLLEKKKKKN